MSIKQVIVVRTDLNMRRGKEAAQCSHASCSFLVGIIKQLLAGNEYALSDAEQSWIYGSFAKIVVSVGSLEELQNIHKNALQAGLVSRMIVDSGRTEFHGIETPTYLAIGPDISERIDPITGHLKLR